MGMRSYNILELTFCIVLVLNKLKHIIVFSLFHLFQNGFIDFLILKGLYVISKYMLLCIKDWI